MKTAKASAGRSTRPVSTVARHCWQEAPFQVIGQQFHDQTGQRARVGLGRFLGRGLEKGLAMNDHEPLAVGDTVRRRDQPWLTGTVWSIERDMTSLVERESSSSRGTIPIRT